MAPIPNPAHPENRAIDTTILINAPLEKVNTILHDFAHYPEWSPLSIDFQGEDKALRLGQTLDVTLKTGFKFSPVVKHIEETGFAWIGELSILFYGTHMFLLSAEGENQTRLHQREEFGGWLFSPVIYLMGGMVQTKSGFENFNEALKKRAESTDI